MFMYEGAYVQNPVRFIIATKHYNYLTHLCLIQDLYGHHMTKNNSSVSYSLIGRLSLTYNLHSLLPVVL